MRRQKSLAALVCAVLLVMISSSGQAQQAAQNTAEPKIIDIRIVSLSLPTAENKVTFWLAIEGENLPDPTSQATVHFDTKNPASPVTVLRTSSNNKESLI